jgi:hypothetical protein
MKRFWSGLVFSVLLPVRFICFRKMTTVKGNNAASVQQFVTTPSDVGQLYEKIRDIVNNELGR